MERFFGDIPICVVWKSAVQFTGYRAGAAQSTRKHFTDTPAVHFGRVQLATVVTQPSRQPGLSLSSSQQEGPTGTPGEVLSCASLRETHKHCTASCTSKLSSFSVTPSLCGVLFIPSKHHIYSTGFASAGLSVSADITLLISLSPQKQQETVTHHQKFFGAFLSMES